MDSNKLVKFIELQYPTLAKNEIGEVIQTWVTKQYIWASIEPLTGREKFLAQQVYTDLTARIRVRYRSDINPTMRLLFGHRIFEINAVVNPGERNEELELLCTERGLGNV